jgi:NAD-dependent deacetylase
MQLPPLCPTAASPVVFVTGAGISAESGVPTFRGPEGYWTVGSTVYHPQDLATNRAYRQMPREVWRWYLYRRSVCRGAVPNPAHHALVSLERELGDAFRLVTQNVDGLHLRAGHSRAALAEVHGDIDWMRDERTDEVLPIPAGLELGRDEPLSDEQWALLRNPATGNRCRPHILWFDEYYEEHLYRSETALRWGRSACLVVVVGTSGAARMPWLVAEAGLAGEALLIDVNPEPNPFRELAAEAGNRGRVVAATAVAGVAEVVAAVRDSRNSHHGAARNP